MRFQVIVQSALFAGLCSSTPIQATSNQVTASRIATQARNIDLAFLALNKCQGQSCYLADASGSSGITPTLFPEGANDEDIKCIVKYNPSVEKLLLDNPNVPKVPKQDTGFSTYLFQYLNGLQRPNERTNGETDTGNFVGQCTPNILIFSKGTLEPTEYGVTLGPWLTSGWDSSWSTNPVVYDPTVSGDFCLGLPGGMVVKDMINQAAVKCPNSKLFLAGYSQGAMVVRNGLAYANPAAKSRVQGVLTFGDPFQGAPIKGYNGPIETYCKPEDGVCGGNFELSNAHLSYVFDSTVGQAKETLAKWAARR